MTEKERDREKWEPVCTYFRLTFSFSTYVKGLEPKCLPMGLYFNTLFATATYQTIAGSCPVWPECRNKKWPKFSKSCPKVVTTVWLNKWWFKNCPKKSRNIWDTFETKFVAMKFQNLPNLVTLALWTNFISLQIELFAQDTSVSIARNILPLQVVLLVMTEWAE